MCRWHKIGDHSAIGIFDKNGSKVWRLRKMFEQSRIKTACLGVCMLTAAMVLPGAANAAGFDLDGVYEGMPPYSSFEATTWYNGHKPAPDSIYGDENNQLGTTTVYYGIGEDNAGPAGTDYFWVYVEADIAAKNMIWEDDATADWELPLGNTDPNVGLTEADVASYRAHHETHHSAGSMKLDFGGATGSEKMVLYDANGDKAFEADLADSGDTSGFGLVGSQDITDYLLGNSICTTALCLARDTAMSFEFKFALNATQNDAFLALFDNGIEFHLSPERGLPLDVPEIPVPAAIWLFGTALIGFIGMSRRTNLA
jgi:hypothetical protein